MSNLTEYKMEERAGPMSLGLYRLGSRSVYRPVIRSISSTDYLVEEWRHATNPNVPILGIKVRGTVKHSISDDICLIDENISPLSPQAVAKNIASQYPEYTHLLRSQRRR